MASSLYKVQLDAQSNGLLINLKPAKFPAITGATHTAQSVYALVNLNDEVVTK